MNGRRDRAIMITGAAGFIGFHLARHYHLLGHRVIGVDKPTAAFATPDIRRHRMAEIRREGMLFEHGDLAEPSFTMKVVRDHQPKIIFHMAASVSIRTGDALMFRINNITAFANLLTAVAAYPPEHFIFASSSSVYGEYAPRPFCESHLPIMPDNPYAASKFVGEQIAHLWSGAFPVTSIRFFNVYGPWGREDMAPFRFADALTDDSEVTIFSGNTSRSWLYIDDAIDACVALVAKPPVQYRVINVAGPQLINTMDVLSTIANRMKKSPRLRDCPSRHPEVSSNPASTDLLYSLINYRPQTIFSHGIEKFLEWHQRHWNKARHPR